MLYINRDGSDRFCKEDVKKFKPDERDKLYKIGVFKWQNTYYTTGTGKQRTCRDVYFVQEVKGLTNFKVDDESVRLSMIYKDPSFYKCIVHDNCSAWSEEDYYMLINKINYKLLPILNLKQGQSLKESKIKEVIVDDVPIFSN